MSEPAKRHRTAGLAEPPRRSGTRPATRELVLPWCVACAQPIWYPRDVCPRCLGIGDRVAAGGGRRRRVRRRASSTCPARAATQPTCRTRSRSIDLAEGVRMMSNVVELRRPTTSRSACRCRLTWQPLSDGRNLPQFEPA